MHCLRCGQQTTQTFHVFTCYMFIELKVITNMQAHNKKTKRTKVNLHQHITFSEMISQQCCPGKYQTEHGTDPDSTPAPPR